MSNSLETALGLPSSQPHLTPQARSDTGSFVEPITGATIARTSSQPIADWVRSLPCTDVGLAGPSTGSTVLDQVRSESDNIKIGYAMGSLAASIEQRIVDHPSVTSENAAQFATALRDRGIALSGGAAGEASANPGIFTYKERCYSNENDLASAVMRDQASTPQLREYTTAMQQRDQLAAMDRTIAEKYTPGLGYSWGQTAYMYARGSTTDPAALNRAYAAGTALDAGFGLGGAMAGVSAARQGLALPGGQARPLTAARNETVTTEPTRPATTRVLEQPARTPTSPVRHAPAPARAPDQFDVQARNGSINMPHILEGHLNPEGKAVGFHSRPGGVDPEGSRMIQVIDHPNGQGVYTGKVQVRSSDGQSWIDKKGMSTFYPDRMSSSDVEAAVRTAYGDALRQGYVGSGRFSGDSG